MKQFPPSPFPVINVGNGEKAFIFNAAHVPGMAASRRFRLVGACAQLKEHIAWSAPNYGLEEPWITTDFDHLVARALNDYGDDLVVSITTPTFLHADFAARAINHGVRKLIIDKPVCPTYQQYRELADLVDSAGASAVVTFNHNYMTPALALRLLVAKVGLDNVEEITSWFWQSWLMTDPGIQQSEWRLRDRFGGLTDIGSHAMMLSSWILGQKISSISNAVMGTAGNHGAQCLDNGQMTLTFENGLQGTTSFHQALQGNNDNLGALVTFREGVLPDGVRHVMFKMTWGADNVLVSKGNGDPTNWAEWRSLDCGPNLFSDGVSPYRFTPGGHSEGWPDGWRRLFLATAGEFWRDSGEEFDLTGNYALPAPTLETAGEQSMAAIAAVIGSFENRCEVSLTQAAAAA